MFFKYYTEDGRAHAIEADKVVIYDNGAKLYERNRAWDAYTIGESKTGEKELKSVYHGAPVTITLKNEVKNARKENLNRKDNYTLTYTPELFKWERRTALYIHVSEIDVKDLGNVLAMETTEEKNYLHAVKLHFNSPCDFDRYNIEYIQCEGHWTIPDGGRWSSCYGSEAAPCYDTYDFTKSTLPKARAKGKGVLKKWITTETEENAEIIVAWDYYSKTIYSDERKRKNAIAAKLNASGQWHDKNEWSHYDIDKIENALGYKLEV